ncbi:MAG: DUF2157 domain-containing protein [Kiritimatiellae bacterium]|jgi:uncharacterized membrane protein|nr:DUF2157 domain-containing protein [Kiritimatiellia bacterium]
MNRKQINWLLGEIETWHAEAIIGSALAQQLKSRYELAKKDQRLVGLIILGSLGALLIGLGIISLLAANWGDIPRDTRAVISFLPLIISYGTALFIGLKKKTSLAFKEPLGIFWGLSIGAGIALISQTYHLPGDLEIFILVWMLLLVPVVWLTRSLGCVAGFYIGLLFWSGYVQDKLGVAVWYWPLSALVLPVVLDVRRRAPDGMRGVFMFWSLLVSSIIALGMTMERSLPGLWLIIYTSFFVVMLLWSSVMDREDVGIWSRPLSLCGGGGLTVVLYLLCYKWPWDNIGPEHYRHGCGHHLWASVIYDFSLTAVLLIATLVLFFLWRRKTSRLCNVGSQSQENCSVGSQSQSCKNQSNGENCDSSLLSIITKALWYSAPLVVTVIYGIASYASSEVEEICSAITCLYVAALSLLTIAEGIGSRMLWMINFGMLLFLALVIGKFFSEEYSFTIKGVVFIVSGVIFFIVNTIFARKLRKEEQS